MKRNSAALGLILFTGLFSGLNSAFAQTKKTADFDTIRSFCSQLVERVVDRDNEINDLEERSQNSDSAIAKPAKKKLSAMAKSSAKDCKISSASDVKKPLWDHCSSDCLMLALDSCPSALHSAENTAQKPQHDFDSLKDFCSGLTDRIMDRDEDAKTLQDQIKAVDLPALQKAEKTTRAKMQIGCRRDCVKNAMVKNGACALSPDVLAEVVSKDDLNDMFLGLDVFYGGQSKYVDYINNAASVDASKACAKILQKDSCVKAMNKSGFSDCDAGAEWIAAYKALSDGQKVIARKKNLEVALKNSVDANCKLTSASDVNKPLWDTCNADCLQKALDSCPTVLAAESKKNKNRDAYCPDCKKNVSENQQPVIRSAVEKNTDHAPYENAPAEKAR